MKSYFLTQFELLILALRSEPKPGTLKDAKEFVMEARAHIEAQVAVFDQLQTWKDRVDKEVREVNVLKMSIEEEMKKYGNAPKE